MQYWKKLLSMSTVSIRANNKLTKLLKCALLTNHIIFMHSSTAPRVTWDIFCRVIDNYGDIGVCWRLARQLVNEHGIYVRLWVDELQALVQIWPEARVTEQQFIAGVDVRHWVDDSPQVEAAQVVIEAFGCETPANYLEQMSIQKRAGHPPVWINLEYLSAECWVDECHGMVSIHPSTGLRKTFFFPGFGAKTGGVLHEQSLAGEIKQFQSNTWLKKLGIAPVDNALRISLFAYENPALEGLLAQWALSPIPIHCLVPAGRILNTINEIVGRESGHTTLTPMSRYQQGHLTLDVIPFLTQTEYDRLLWSCDINFVRGEDSFVRAQLAGKPFVWHIYPQEEGIHLIKLQAFLDKYLQTASPSLAQVISDFWLKWNTGEQRDGVWQTLLEELEPWQQHSVNWERSLAQESDLAANLVRYCHTIG